MAATLVPPMLPTPAGPTGGQRSGPARPTRVLITNDDGVGAPGLGALAAAAVLLGFEVVIAAPSSDRSGSGAAIGPVSGSRLVDEVRVELPGLGPTNGFAVGAPPALAVLLVAQGAFGTPPKIVLSGINRGLNTGLAVLHSGTVGAAVTAANLGLRSLAVSMATGSPAHLDTAGVLAGCALVRLRRAPAGTALNLNVPNLAIDDVRGLRWAPLAGFGSVRAVEQGAGDGAQVELRTNPVDVEPGTDTALVAEGFATVTSVVGIRAAAAGPDLGKSPGCSPSHSQPDRGILPLSATEQ